jgi:hypothetical protein
MAIAPEPFRTSTLPEGNGCKMVTGSVVDIADSVRLHVGFTVVSAAPAHSGSAHIVNAATHAAA